MDTVWSRLRMAQAWGQDEFGPDAPNPVACRNLADFLSSSFSSSSFFHFLSILYYCFITMSGYTFRFSQYVQYPTL